MCYSESSEIVEAPVTPSKKRTRTTPPSPGTPEFVSLPAVSLTCVFTIIVYLAMGSSIVGANGMRLWPGAPLKVPLSDQYSELKLPLPSFMFPTSVFHRPISEGRPKYVFTLNFFLLADHLLWSLTLHSRWAVVKTAKALANSSAGSVTA